MTHPFAPPEDIRLVVDTVRRFVLAELRPLEDQVEAEGRLDPNLAKSVFQKSRALGLYGMNMPAELGGGGLDTVSMCLVEEQAGQTTDILVRRAFGNVYEILLACEGDQRDEWLKPAVTGDRICSIAITEPGAGSDAAGIKTRARCNGGDFILDGTKHFVSDGDVSDFFVVSAITDPALGPRGISMFLVDKAMPGVTVSRIQDMMGLRGTNHVELHFDKVRLGPRHLLGERGRGLRLVLATIGRIRLAHIGARACGMARRVLDLTIEHARARHQFGTPIGQFQMVQTMLADSALEIDAARLMVLNAAWETDQGRDPREKVSMVKVYAAETMGRVADRAIQIFGGSGFSKDLPFERFYRDARVLRIYDGTSEIHRGIVARSLLKDGAGFING